MIEAVPNVSEGRDAGTIEAIAKAIRAVSEVHLLHTTSDPDHHRTVFTYVSENPDRLREATLAMFEIAVSRIDLRRHSGEHPRVGAVDVVPFVPLRGSHMDECVALSVRTGAEVASRFGIPVYLYEHAAREEHRRELPAIRSGGFEKFGDKIQDPRWAPDFGPAEVHPSAGVTIIGARVPLVAFNVQLATDRMDIAGKIARTVRAVSGGLPFVRALPIHLHRRGIVQVSMNLLDYRRTSIQRAFGVVREEAARHEVEVLSTEIVGLVPAEALDETADWFRKLEKPGIVLEKRIEEALRQARVNESEGGK